MIKEHNSCMIQFICIDFECDYKQTVGKLKECQFKVDRFCTCQEATKASLKWEQDNG